MHAPRIAPAYTEIGSVHAYSHKPQKRLICSNIAAWPRSLQIQAKDTFCRRGFYLQPFCTMGVCTTHGLSVNVGGLNMRSTYVQTLHNIAVSRHMSAAIAYTQDNALAT